MRKIPSILSNMLYIFAEMWRFSKTLFIGRLSLAILNGFIPPLNAYVLKVLIEKISERNWHLAVNTIVAIVSINLINDILHSFINKKLGSTNSLFRNFLMFKVTAKTANMDYEILYDPAMIQKKDMAVKAIQENRSTKYVDVIFSYISYIITFASIMYLLSSFSWWVYLIVLLLCSIKICTAVVDKKQSYDAAVEMAPINTEVTYYMTTLTDEAYVNELRMYSISDWIVGKYNKCIIRTQRILERLLSSSYKTRIVRNVLSAAENAFIYLFVTVQMLFYGMSFADFTLVTSVLRSFSDVVTNATRGLLDIAENSAYIEHYRQFMNTENHIAVAGKGTDVSLLEDCDCAYELSDVSFAYPGSKSNTLNNVDLNVQKGKFYVIVGKNGAGKTTLVRLLCRLYDVSGGSIKYMHEDIRNIEYKSYRDNIGVVFQDYKHYCMSIAENVAMNEYDDTEETTERILAALYKAGLKDKIESLPNGIHTQLGKIFDNEGILLSGGELQKLALARVLFQDPSVVILDEPSSALDALAEDELIQTFNSALAGKTVFYISHRLSVAKYADKVIYMEDGRITGFDNHENLLKNSESYNNMYEAQARHYK